MLLASPGRRHTVSVWAFDGMAPFELGAVVEVFGLPRPELEIPWYDLRVCSLEREPMRAVGGFMMTTHNGLDVFAGADTVMVDDFILDRVPGGTIVRLLGSGVPATPEWDTQYWRLRTSWQQAMTRLKVFVEKQPQTGAPP